MGPLYPFFCGVLYVLRTGIPWRDLPEKPFGHWRNVHKRHMRLPRQGGWQNIFDALRIDSDETRDMIDSTICRAHQHSAGYIKKKTTP